MTFADRLADITDARGPLCLGIDAHPALLRSWGLADDAAGARDFGLRAVSAADGRVGIVKPQVAFYERFGSAGFAALEDVIAAARSAGLLVIADAKRGDIGSTVEGYADAWLRGGSPLESDAVTASPYLGVAALGPLLTRAAESHKAVFVLAVTSNPEAARVQGAEPFDGGTVAGAIVDELRMRAEPGSGGVVLGATTQLADYGIDAERLSGLSILAPGFGAQGARLEDIRHLFGDASPRVIPSVSRSVLAAGPDRIGDALDAARDEVAAWRR